MTRRTRHRNPRITPALKSNLRYVTDQGPGLHRVRAGKGFSIRNERNRLVRDRATIKRVDLLRIPPAWKDVWICPSPKGHLQATGRDARGRKQYRYHDDWTNARSKSK